MTGGVPESLLLQAIRQFAESRKRNPDGRALRTVSATCSGHWKPYSDERGVMEWFLTPAGNWMSWKLPEGFWPIFNFPLRPTGAHQPPAYRFPIGTLSSADAASLDEAGRFALAQQLLRGAYQTFSSHQPVRGSSSLRSISAWAVFIPLSQITGGAAMSDAPI